MVLHLHARNLIFSTALLESVGNFEKYSSILVDTLMTSYDYGSVMHYESDAFAINSSIPTIVPLLNSSAFIGQRIQLSPIDILEIQRYYGCVPTPSDSNATSTGSSPLYILQSRWALDHMYLLSIVLLVN
jgi:Astacin (Peptidase family M12A)